MTTKKPKKHYPTDIPLAENVRLLKCGAWGYIHEGKAILKSEDVNKINEFSKWVHTIANPKMILLEASYNQKLIGETKVLPKCHLCDNGIWRVEGNNYESQTKIPK